MHAFYVNHDFKTDKAHLKKGQLYVSSEKLNVNLAKAVMHVARGLNSNKVTKALRFCDTSEIIKRAVVGAEFKNLLIIRFGGIGDLIALTSIIDYFDDKNIYFVTQEKYMPLFDWFIEKPHLIPTNKPIFNNIKFKDRRLDTWAEFNGNGVVEYGHKRNWFEVFFALTGVKPGDEFYRPQLKTERITDKQSNIQKFSTGKPSILICNKATAMMRTIKASTLIDCIPDKDKDKYDIFVHEINLDKDEQVDAIKIPKCSYGDFFLDCYDSDMVISVDTGALHFREGIEKPAIGLYNAFTTDSRTKYYKYTKSFDIKSNCELQPCFIHETEKIKNCPKGEGFSAPCFNPKFNVSLKEQLTKILKENL
jgi:hypothetical protein